MKRRSMGWLAIAAIALIGSLLLGPGWRSVAADPGLILAQTPEAPPALEAAQPALSGTYEDPQGQFQVGILEGYTVSTTAGSPLFQLPDGSLAYSVVRVPLSSDAPLPDIALVETARQALGNGEGFQTQTFTPVPGGGLQIAWSGRLSQGAAPPQPVSGTVLAKQQGAIAYLIVVAALESGAPQVPQVVSTLVDTLQIL